MLTLVLCLVVVAGFVRNALLVCVGVHTKMAAALARPSACTVYDVLYGQVRRWPRPLALDVDAIGEGAGGTHRPTGTAV